MKFFKITLFLIVFLFIQNLKAQTGFGATLGFAGTTFNVETNQTYKDTASNFDKSYPKTSMRLGINFGVFYNLKLTKLISLRPTLSVQLNQIGNIYLNKPEEKPADGTVSRDVTLNNIKEDDIPF